MKVEIFHYANQLARNCMRLESNSDIIIPPSPEYLDWIMKMKFHEGLLLAPQEDTLGNVSRARDNRANNDFEVERALNKAHLTEDFDDRELSAGSYMRMYFLICGYLQNYLMRFEKDIDLLAVFSSDIGLDSGDFPSAVVTFGLRRNPEDEYVLDSDDYTNGIHVGTRMTIAYDTAA